MKTTNVWSKSVIESLWIRKNTVKQFECTKNLIQTFKLEILQFSISQGTLNLPCS